MDQTLYQQLKQTGYLINRIGNDADIDRQPTEARRSFDSLRRTVRAAQDIAKDYELTEFEEDTAMQLRILPKLVRALEKLREQLLKVSEYDLIGAVAIAQISAEIDGQIAKLQ